VSGLIAVAYLLLCVSVLHLADADAALSGKPSALWLACLPVIALTGIWLLRSARCDLLLAREQRVEEALVREALSSAGASAGMSPTAALERIAAHMARLQPRLAAATMDACAAGVLIIAASLLHPLFGIVAVSAAGLAGVLFVSNLAQRQGVTQQTAASRPDPALLDELLHASGAGGRAYQNLSTRLIQEREQSDRPALSAVRAFAQLGLQVELVREATRLIILVAFAWLVAAGEVSLGVALAGFVLIDRAFSPMLVLVNAAPALKRASASRIELVRHFAETASRSVQPTTTLPYSNHGLVVSGLWTGGADASRSGLRNICFTVRPGEALGVLGSSGAGKSLLARTLVQAELREAGMVEWSGPVSPESVGGAREDSIGYLPQDARLWPGSISDNISSFDNARHVTAKVIQAAEAAGAHADILRLAGGYDTWVGAGFERPSATLAQRIALARALYRDPDLIVLDDPAASLGAGGEGLLFDVIASAKARGAAVIVMTHGANLLPCFDKLLVLENGEVQAFGPRDEVLKQGPGGALSGAQIRLIGSSN
jgi:ABC-type protease/lipase transport system fused ATPase/permease subunit